MSEGETTAVASSEGQGEAAPTGASAVLSNAADPSGGATGETPSSESAAWSAGLSEDDLSFIGTKGWDKSEDPVSEMLKSYRNVERLRGVNAEQLLRIPEAGNEEQAAEFYSRLGVPESPDGYESPTVNVLGETLQGEPLAAISHALHHTPEQHAAFMGQVGEFLQSTAQEQAEARNAQLSAEKSELDRDWGGQLEENTLAAKTGFGQLGWDESTIDAIEQAVGYRKTMELGALVGRMTAEHGRGDDAADTSVSMQYGLTRESARDQIRLKGSELAAKAARGDKSAKQELDNLNRVAFHS